MNIPQIIFNNARPLFYVSVLLFGVSLIRFLLFYRRFKHSRYKLESGNSIIKTIRNRGDLGEFLIFEELEKRNVESKILANVYLSKEDGSTTEIDVMMVDPTGIYVFESKNFSGWIFGDEKGKNWTQSLKGGKKIKFYNPIWQNNGHINGLRRNLTKINPALFYSFIVFGNQCELKKVTVNQPELRIIKRNLLRGVLDADVEKRPNVFSNSEVMQIYEELSRFTLTDEKTKQNHIDGIKSKVNY